MIASMVSEQSYKKCYLILASSVKLSNVPKFVSNRVSNFSHVSNVSSMSDLSVYLISSVYIDFPIQNVKYV